jgi:co-chaperonin GroES (HSP10)
LSAEPKKKSSIDQAYTEGDDRTLNPELLDMSIIDRMPNPSGWRMLVLPYAGQRKTKAGILLTKETMDREALATVVAYVVKQGPLCYGDKEKFGDEPWCKEKQWVLIGRYSGARFKLEDGAEVRIINDDEVIGTIINPDDIVSFA